MNVNNLISQQLLWGVQPVILLKFVVGHGRRQMHCVRCGCAVDSESFEKGYLYLSISDDEFSLFNDAN